MVGRCGQACPRRSVTVTKPMIRRYSCRCTTKVPWGRRPDGSNAVWGTVNQSGCFVGVGEVSSVWLIPALGRRVPAQAAIGYMLVYLSIVSGKAHPSHHPRNMLGLPHLCARAVPSAELRRHRAPGCASVLGSGQGCTTGRHLSCKSAHEPMIVGRDQRPRQGGEG